MLSQQSSFSGMRTAFTRQVLIASTEATSFEPSEKPQPWTQAYSVPERLTPCSRTACPRELTSWLPWTRSPESPVPGVGVGVAAGVGVAVGVGVGAGVAVGAGVGVGSGALTENVAAELFQLYIVDQPGENTPSF